VLADPAAVGAELLRVDRGGDVTYHGPGQLIGYPVLSVPSGPDATPGYIHEIEELVIEVLNDLGLEDAGRLSGYPGVWVGGDGGEQPRKICAIGARHSRRRTMHGFALNVNPDLSMFERIVPCGIAGLGVTSLAAEGVTVAIRDVVETTFARAAQRWGAGRPVERQAVSWRPASAPPAATQLGANPPATASPLTRLSTSPPPVAAKASQPSMPAQPVRLTGKLARLAAAGVHPGTAQALDARKPSWLRAKARMGPRFGVLRKTVRALSLVTVCEEAGCPNIYECWAEGTATFMINGSRCTRACGFCQVATEKPLALDPDEPARVAEAVARLRLAHAVVTCVARDDLADGGASGFVATIEAIRRRSPSTAVEVLISDCKGDPAALAKIFAIRPDIVNHNVETVPRLQRAVRPSASYTRSLAVLARARNAGLVTKSGLMVGLGETEAEVVGVLADLHAAGVSIVTIGQYIRPSAAHLPVARWWTPEESAALAQAGQALGIAHVEASPLTRSSYHARQSAARAELVGTRSSGGAA